MMVDLLQPREGDTIYDPACGTGGFFLAGYDFLTDPENYKLDKAQKHFLKHSTFYGNEIVANTRRLCLMNMFLHNIGEIDGESLISPNDALIAPSPVSVDYVLANPPFGKKSSMSFTNEEGEQETDELTYNLHIMLRFDLERALLSGDLSVADLPGAWNERIQADLGLTVPDDRHGCLQDIHWSMGAIGYFPTYTLGNLYAAQLWEAAVRDIPDLEEGISAGEFSPLLGWLRDHVHRHGRRHSAAGLCRLATGSDLGAEAFFRYLRGKLLG